MKYSSRSIHVVSLLIPPRSIAQMSTDWTDVHIKSLFKL